MVCLAASLLVLVFAGLAQPVSSEAFLGGRHYVSKAEIESALLLDLSSTEKIASFEDELRPMYKTLPKNEQGQLDISTGRYALHRYFVHKHGWYVKGLDPQGAGMGHSNTSQVISGLVPAYIMQLFEQQLDGKGLALHELAVFAATLSDIIFQEGFGSLWEVYRRLELPVDQPISEADFDMAVRAYFSELVCGAFFDFQVKADFRALEQKARDFYPEYDDIMMWALDIRNARDFVEESSRNPFTHEKVVTWERAAEHLRELMHNFGSLTKDECRTLKEELLEMEVPGTGRVLLSDFYADDNLQMHESVAYLRNLGALEEQASRAPRIIMSNYIASAGRCTPFSSYFSICCSDECEGILGNLERILGTPTSTPARIAEVVGGLSSDTRSAPWNVSAPLMHRLHEIANHHQGDVPLHGRLFMQWMHHAFPAECPFPHVSGTTSPMSQDDWLVLHQDIDSVEALHDEKTKFANAQHPAEDEQSDLPWTSVEELVAFHSPSNKPRIGHSIVRAAMAIVALVSFALPLLRASKALLSSGADKNVHLV